MILIAIYDIDNSVLKNLIPHYFLIQVQISAAASVLLALPLRIKKALAGVSLPRS